MKLRIIFLVLIALLLSACSFSLAEDITPPPNYISPTPPPTLGPLYPPQPVSVERGAAIYADKCVDCHGPQGMGDGPDGKQLPVPVAGLGLPQTARPASPSDWYMMVSNGNLERFMPPFNSLTDQQRWDVVGYSMSLHVTADEIERGRGLFETNCQDCPTDFFKDPASMSALSEDDLVALLKTGSDNVTALSGALSDDNYYAVAAWLRTLTYESTLPTPTPEPATPTTTLIPTDALPAALETTITPAVDASAEGTPLATETGLPSAPSEGTPALSDVESPIAETPTVTGSETPVAPSGTGTVTGQVSGGNAAGLEVSLHILLHGQDQTSGPQEILALTSAVEEDGSYTFKGVQLADGQMYYSEITYAGITYQSELVVPDAGAAEISLPEVKLYEISEDYSVLSFAQVHVFLDFADQVMQVVVVYTFSNPTDKAILVEATSDVPFIKLPDGAQNVGFDLSQDSEPILAAEGGFALLPSENPYGLVAFYTLPYDGKLKFSQPFVLSADSVLLLAPEGVRVKSDRLTSGGTQTFQEVTYQELTGSGLQAGDVLELNLSGMPKGGTSGTSTDTRQNLLIGVGALGVMLILAGGWMYLRDRNRLADEQDAEEEEEDEFESQEDLLDAIIALDDLHRSGKIPDEAYQQRRAELKSRLKDV